MMDGVTENTLTFGGSLFYFGGCGCEQGKMFCFIVCCVYVSYIFNNDGVVKLCGNACSTGKSQHVVKLHSNACSTSKSQRVVCVVDSYLLCSFSFDGDKK
jgi:hypothetical protein